MAVASAFSGRASIPGERAATLPYGRYSFELNGEPLWPGLFSLQGNPTDPQPGDLIAFRGGEIVLKAPGKYKLRIPDTEPSMRPNVPKVFLAVGGEEEFLAVVSVFSFDGEDGETHYMNPLSELADPELKKLRGVIIDQWRPQLLTILPRLSFAECSLTINLRDRTEIPELPPDVRYLSLYTKGPSFDYSGVEKLPELLYLYLSDSQLSGEFDARILARARNLRYLSISWFKKLAHAEALAELRQLRYLDLDMCGMGEISEPRCLGFLENLRTLRVVRVDDLSHLDLNAFVGLGAIREIYLTRCHGVKLPAGSIPSLTKLWLLGCTYGGGYVSSFQSENPQCVVVEDWSDAFRDACREAEVVRIRSVDIPDASRPRPLRSSERLIFEEKDPKAVKELLEKFHVEEPDADWVCMCPGDLDLEFYGPRGRIAVLSYHHFKSLRWQGWPSDVYVAPDFQEFLDGWLVRRGVRIWEGPGGKRLWREQ